MSGATEAFARVKIDALLQDAGWNLTDGSSVLFEHALPDGTQADYVLSAAGRVGPWRRCRPSARALIPSQPRTRADTIPNNSARPSCSCRTAGRCGSSSPFEAGEHGRVAIKTMDDGGIESLKIVELA